ncbi:MAG TPA: Uma2 family endonuclease, partial [Gemmataceae bacterium]|nr:Uma2 family endonuclease [Gemmataceae bacterium]
GPAPLWVSEVLSERSAQQRDLKEKLDIYAALGVAEYVLADPTGVYLPERLLLKRLMPDGSWKDEKDADGGITSSLQFRVILEAAGALRVVDCVTGWHYVHPDEADHRIRELNAELQRLRNAASGNQNP